MVFLSIYRQPIITVLGHVDSGKTSLLDKIRGTAVQTREAGGITQHIGASFFPKLTIEKLCGNTLISYNFNLIVPGLLMIDTPGHEVFRNLRVRGGSASDISILVIDITKGFQPQTHESIKILLSKKVPFLIAANKIDALHGWKKTTSLSITESLKNQKQHTLQILDEKMYDIISALSFYNLESERFDKNSDFKNTISIIPVSASNGEGIQELLTILIGLVQKFLIGKLEIGIDNTAKGTILEIGNYDGLGKIVKALHIDGLLKTEQNIIFATDNGPFITSIRAILMPAPLDEIKDPKKKFTYMDQISPASSIIIAPSEMNHVYPGSPFYSFPRNSNPEKYIQLINQEIDAITWETDDAGVILKADTLGSLEALTEYCKQKSINVRRTAIGPLVKTDIIDAVIVKKKDELQGAILTFNVDHMEDAKNESIKEGIPIFKGRVLYSVVEDYIDWIQEYDARKKSEDIAKLTQPGKIVFLRGYTFRKSNPAIFGVKVLGGVLKNKYALIREDGKKVGYIHQIQEKGNSIKECKKNMEVAVSVKGAIIDRDIKENDVMMVDIPESDVKLLMKNHYQSLDKSEKEILNELIDIKRKTNISWAY